MIKENRELWEAWFQDRSDFNLNELVKAYWNVIRAVFHRRFSQFYWNIDDYISHGSVGLITAVKAYTIDDERDFLPFAYSCVFREMRYAYRHQNKKNRQLFEHVADFQWQHFPVYDSHRDLEARDLVDKMFEGNVWLRRVFMDKYGHNVTYQELQRTYCSMHASPNALQESLRNKRRQIRESFQELYDKEMK